MELTHQDVRQAANIHSWHSIQTRGNTATHTWEHLQQTLGKSAAHAGTLQQLYAAP